MRNGHARKKEKALVGSVSSDVQQCTACACYAAAGLCKLVIAVLALNVNTCVKYTWQYQHSIVLVDP
jgi:hypothetical protein